MATPVSGRLGLKTYTTSWDITVAEPPRLHQFLSPPHLSEGRVAGLSRDMRLGETERFELTEGFRYTPEIPRCREWIDQTFPAAGISEELGFDWRPIGLGSMKQSGARPILFRAKNTQDIWHCVFPRARERREIPTEGVARGGTLR
jgi:hypothetical protein